MTPELHEQIKRLAAAVHRTVSNWIEARPAALVASEAAAAPRNRG